MKLAAATHKHHPLARLDTHTLCSYANVDSTPCQWPTSFPHSLTLAMETPVGCESVNVRVEIHSSMKHQQ